MQKQNILFINTRNAQCSIYQSAKKFADILRCEDYNLDYVEINHLDIEQFKNGKIVGNNLKNSYDVYVFNFHIITMNVFENINPQVIANFGGKKINLVFDVDVNTPYPEFYDNFPKHLFDHHIIFDPTLEESENIHTFQRPLIGYRSKQKYNSIPEIPIIGSHGYPNFNKNFPALIQQCGLEFEKCIVRINLPNASYMPGEIQKMIVSDCYNAKPNNVDLIITHNYYNNIEDLISWCGENDLNAFFYDRPDPGLSAASDEAILSGAPLAISKNKAFRHIHQFIKPFPEWSLRESILYSQQGIEEMSSVINSKYFIEKFKQLI